MIRRPPRSTRAENPLALHDALPSAVGRGPAGRFRADGGYSPDGGGAPPCKDSIVSPRGRYAVRLSSRRLADAPEFPAPHVLARVRPARSEEHTSELQSLMRISYAVFCLKKTKHPKPQ